MLDKSKSHGMTEQEKIKKWVDTWQQADSAMNEIKKAELQDDDYYAKNQQVILSLLKYAAEHRTERKTSGFVIQQQRFRKLKKLNPAL